jgi:hypothetical protein
MKKLRIMLAGILLTMPLFALNASAPVTLVEGVHVQQSPSATGYCWVYWNGQWYLVSC